MKMCSDYTSFVPSTRRRFTEKEFQTKRKKKVIYV